MDLVKFSLCSLAGVTASQIPVSSLWSTGIHFTKFGPQTSSSDFPTPLCKDIRNTALEIRFVEAFGLAEHLGAMYAASRCKGVTNTAEISA